MQTRKSVPVEGVLASLCELADPAWQQAAWLDASPPRLPSPVELACQLFDDTGLTDALATGTVFSDSADELLRDLSRDLALLDLEREPRDLLAAPAWSRIVGKARIAQLELERVERQSRR